MKNNTRFILVSALIVSLTIYIGVLSYGLIKYDSVRSKSNDLVKLNNKKSELIFAMLASARERVVLLYRMINSDDPFYRDELFLKFNYQGAVFATSRIELLEQKLSPKEHETLTEQGVLVGFSIPIQLKLIELIQADKIEEAKVLLNEDGIKAQERVLEKLLEILHIQEDNSDDILTSINTQFTKSRNLILVWSFFAFVLASIVAYLVIRRTTKTENLLFTEMEKARATLKSISNAVLRLDTNGNIVFSNQKADELFNRPLINKKITEVIDSVSMDDIFTKNHIDNGKLGRHKLIVDRNEYWIDLIMTDIQNQDSEEIGKVIVLHDNTEVIDAQEKLELANKSLEKRVTDRTQNLEEANNKLKHSLLTLADAQEQLVYSEKMASLGGLVAGISHEINTPIGIGVTSATSIEEIIKSLEELFLSGELTKSMFQTYINNTRKGLDILINNLKRASDLIRSFKQVAVDQSSDDFRDVILHDYCDEIILSLLPKLKKTSVIVNNKINKDIKIFTNPGAVYQIISNLIVNSLTHAFDANKEIKPEITIQSDTKKSGFIKLYFYDNGSGVDDNVLPKIFDPFFTTKRGHGGSGLGMNIIYNLVNTTLKGSIVATNMENMGLKLTLELPETTEIDFAGELL